MLPLPLYILAGGRSKRFGSDKARAPHPAHTTPKTNQQTPLILHTLNQLAPVTSTAFAVADQPDKYTDLNLTTIADPTPHLGPLAGLLTALQHHNKAAGSIAVGYIILAACDSLTLNPNWITKLATTLAASLTSPLEHQHNTPDQESPQHLAACFQDPPPSNFPQPMPGLYHTRLIPLIQQQLESNQRSLTRFLNQPETNTLTLPLPYDWPAQPSANTPEDLNT